MGLGKFFARALAARKQNLILVARSREKLKAIASDLKGTHAISVQPIVFDLAAAEQDNSWPTLRKQTTSES
jgi:uncharacterized protein